MMALGAAVRLSQDTEDRRMVVEVLHSLLAVQEVLFATAVVLEVFDFVADSGPY